jgi:curved DNA-binding protein CbpA
MTTAANKLPNYYNLLGIDPGADQQTVKQAY